MPVEPICRGNGTGTGAVDERGAKSDVICRALDLAMSARFFSHGAIVKALELAGSVQARKRLDEDALRVELRELPERARSCRPGG